MLITPREAGGYGLDAQWSDDFHHALHIALTGETHGYYADFEPLGALAKVCERGFFHDGTYSSFRGRDHGAPIDTAAMPTWRLVFSSQNHDQVGNRAVGDRITEALDSTTPCAALVTLCGPFAPMLFQGEEWAATTPFQFFTSHREEELGRLTAEGRVQEFARHGWDPDAVPAHRIRRRSSGEAGLVRARVRSRRADAGGLPRPDAAASASTPSSPTRRSRTSPARSTRPRASSPSGGESLLVLVNFGDQPMAVEVGDVDLLFETESGVDVAGGVVPLPAHAGALVGSLRPWDRPTTRAAEVDDLVIGGAATSNSSSKSLNSGGRSSPRCARA